MNGRTIRGVASVTRVVVRGRKDPPNILGQTRCRVWREGRETPIAARVGRVRVERLIRRCLRCV